MSNQQKSKKMKFIKKWGHRTERRQSRRDINDALRAGFCRRATDQEELLEALNAAD